MKKENLKNGKYLIIGIIAIIAIIIIAAFLIKGIGGKNVGNSGEQELIDGEEVIECIDIDTPYATLKFPKEWSDKIRIETIEADVYTVKFYGIVKGKDEIHLTDIIFGGTEGYTVGYLSIEGTNEPLAVNIIYYDSEFDDTWTEDEKFEIQEMQGVVEYVMDKLIEMDGFELAD